MKIFVLFLTLFSTSFGTYPGYVPAPVNVHPANIKSHSFSTEVRHDVPVAAPAVAIHAPKSIHAVEDVVIPSAVVNPATFAVHAAPKSIHTVVAPELHVPVPVATFPVKPHVVESFSHGTQIQHDAPVAFAPKSIHAINTVAAVPAAGHVVDVAAPKSIHAPLALAVAPVIKSFSYATEIQHDVPTPIVSVAPVSIAAAPKSIHAVQQFSVPPAVAPVVDIRVPTSIHAPVQIPAIKSFSYGTEIHHNAPVSVPVAVGAAPKSIHAVAPFATAPVAAPKSIHTVTPFATASAAAPIVNIRVPTSIHAPELNAFTYGSQIHHSNPVSVPIAPKSIHALTSAAAVHPVAPVVPTLHGAGIPAVKSFTFGSEIQHNAPVPVAVEAAPKSIHAYSAPAIAPVVNIAAPTPLLKSFSYGTEIQHDAAVKIQAPIAPVIAAPKSIHHSAISSVPVHPVRAIHAQSINAHHPISSVVPPVVPISAAKSYTTEIRRRIPLSAPIHYSPAPVVVTSPVALQSSVAKLRNNLAYGQILPVTADGVNFHLNRNIYARIAAPGAYLWNGHSLKNGVGYVAGIAGPLAYNPVPVYYRNFIHPSNAVYNYIRGK